MIETKLKCPWCDTSPELRVIQGEWGDTLTLGCVNSECKAQVNFEEYVRHVNRENTENAVKFLIESWDKRVVGSQTKFEKNDDN